MIGVFDSGYGGLTILRAFLHRLPDYDYCYFGDNARAPYGSRSKQEIVQFTWEGVRQLFENGCELVILACNTSSANALCEIQQKKLAAVDGDKRVLGILVPTIEKLTGTEWADTGAGDAPAKTVGIIGTQQTIASGTYLSEIQKRAPNIRVVQQACPNLVPLIEQNAPDTVLDRAIARYINQLKKTAGGTIDALLLGCTHYALIANRIRKQLPSGVTIYNQPEIVAASLRNYLDRHPDLEQRLSKTNQRLFFTSGDPHTVTQAARRFYGRPLPFKKSSGNILSAS